MTLDDLAAYGANVEEGVGRCMGMADFYVRLVESVKTDANFGQLKEAIEAGNLDAAFASSHALKGILANLSITPLLNPVTEICELLRNRTQMDYAALLDTIDAEFERFCAL